MTDLLRIVNWKTNFENNRTRELKVMTWLPIPVKLDGDGYTELLDHQNGAAHFGAWIALLEVAAHCEERGVLMRGRGPHTASSLARITRFPVKIFEEAIPRLVSIGWISAEPWQASGTTLRDSRMHAAPTCDDPAGIPHEPAASRARAVKTGLVEERLGEESICDSSPPTPHPTARALQGPRQDPGALPPEPPVTQVSEGSQGGDAQDADSSRDVRRTTGDRDRPEVAQPPSVPANGRRGAYDPLPGEDQLEPLAAELFAMWPNGAKGAGTPVQAQRALLDLLKTGRIWPDESPPDPLPPPGFGRSFSELLAVSRAWCRLWSSGEGRAWNLGLSYLGRGRDGGGGMCFLQDPPAPSNGRGRASPVAGTRQLGMPADILAAIDDGLKTTEGFEEWRPEDEAATANGART